METKMLTLNQIFLAPEFQEHHIHAFENQQKLSEIKLKLEGRDPSLNWADFVSVLMKKSGQLLDFNLEDILFSAWQKYNEVKKIIESDDFDSNEELSIPLVQHTVVSEHHPKIEVKIDGIIIDEIDFELLLELELSGIILSIYQKKIQKIKAGKCLAKATFSCEGILLFSDETKEIQF